MEAGPPVVLIIGATGSQGSSVARHLLESKRFIVHCLVRNKRSKKSLKLEELGAKLFVGNLDNPSSLQECVKGIDYCFLNTSFNVLKLEKPENEVIRGMNIVNVLAKNYIKEKRRLKCIIYSSLPVLANNIESYPKNKIGALLKSYNLPNIIVYPTFYYENFIHTWPFTRHLFSRKLHFWLLPFENNKILDNSKPKKNEELKESKCDDEKKEKYVTMNDRLLRMPHMSVEDDFGGVVLGILQSRKTIEEYMDKSLFILSEVISIAEITDTFSKTFNEPFTIEPLTKSQFYNLPFPKQLLEMLYWYGNQTKHFKNMKYLQQNMERFKTDLEKCKKLYPKLTKGVTQWCEKEAVKNKILGKNLNGYNRTFLAWAKRYAIVKEFVTRSDVIIPVCAVGVSIFAYFTWNYGGNNNVKRSNKKGQQTTLFKLPGLA